jgi:hypothetical protein
MAAVVTGFNDDDSAVGRFRTLHLSNVGFLGFRFASPQALRCRPLRGLNMAFLQMAFCFSLMVISLFPGYFLRLKQ